MRTDMLRDRFTESVKAAMKAGDKPRLSTLRLMQAALKDRDIDARGNGKEPLGDDEILALLQKMVKQRQESMALYDTNGRPELAAAERAEIAVISEFMPQQMGEDEMKAAIGDAIASAGATSMKDMGKVIALLRTNFAGRMDFGRASAVVKEMLPKG